MMRIRLAGCFLLMALLAASFVQAKGPPTKISVAGPGLNGTLEITDPNLVDGLGLGALENTRTMRASQPPEVSGEGYEMQRFYCTESGSCHAFDRLHYYLNLTGDTDHIFYDGLVEGSSEYDGKWFEVTVEAQKRMRNLLDSYSAARPYLVLGSSAGQIQVRDPQTLKLLTTIRLDVQQAYFWKIGAQMMGRSLRFATDNGDRISNYALDLTSGALCRLNDQPRTNSLYYASPDGRWVYGLRLQDGLVKLDFYQVGVGEYRDLFAAEAWGAPRGIWNAESTRFYLVGAQQWAAFDPNTREPVVVQPLQLSPAGSWYEVAAAQDDRLYLYHPLGRYWIYDYEADKRGEIPRGLFVLNLKTGAAPTHWQPDLSLAQVIPGGDKLYAIQARLETDTAQLYALDWTTGEVSTAAELGAGRWFAAYTALDDAALNLTGTAHPCPHNQPTLLQRPPVPPPPTAVPETSS
jgi:hypothetical protein